MTEPEVIDRAVLQDLLTTTGNDAVFLAELIDTYLEDGAAMVVAMAHAVSSDDAPALRRAAHSLKANSATLGARSLASLCQQVEEQAREGSLGADELVMSIELAFAEVQRELRLLRPA